MAKRYELVQTVEGRMIATRFSEEYAQTNFVDVRGYRVIGAADSPRLRPELQGEPKFEGLCGPMWGGLDNNGDQVIRYEDWETYERLSA